MTKKALTVRQILVAFAKVMATTYQAAPLIVILQIAGAFLTAALPVATTYFAALSTTALADAYIGVPGADSKLFLYVGITVLLGVAVTAWQTMNSYISELVRYRVEAIVSDRMYEHFHAIDFWRYDDKDTIDMYERAKQFAQFFPYVFERVTQVVTQIFIFAVSLGALALVSWWLALILVVAVVPGAVVQMALSRKTTKHWQENVETRRRKNIIEWSLFEPEQMAELRLYNVVQHLLTLRQKLREKDEKVRIEFERKFILKRLGADLIEAAAEAAALIWTAVQIIAHQQPIGQFLFVQQTVSRALSSVGVLVNIINSVDEDVANLFDYQRFMDLPTTTKSTDSIPKLKTDISLQNIQFRYPNSEVDVIKDVSLSIKKGQHVAIVGENGAGKSTLVKLITGLYAPSAGAVMVDGRDIITADIESWHQQLAVLQQDFIQYRFATVKENVSYGRVLRRFDKATYDLAMRNAEAADFVKKLPKADDTYVNKWMESNDAMKGMELSGGQWQRLALARNFYRDSPIVILDEPTSAIDALAESRIFNRLFRQKDKTIIIISHRLTTVKKADKIFVLDKGALVESGTHEQLVANKQAYYKLFESQL